MNFASTLMKMTKNLHIEHQNYTSYATRTYRHTIVWFIPLTFMILVMKALELQFRLKRLVGKLRLKIVLQGNAYFTVTV